MSIVMNRKTRRQFLLGTGQTLLALPLLPSLLSKEALAQSAAPAKRLLVLYVLHDQVVDLWPSRALATTPVGNFGTKEFLLRSQFSSATAVSPILSNPMHQTLLAKDQITILRGLNENEKIYSSPWQGHATHVLGGDLQGSGSTTNATFDAVIENSKAFYPTNTPASTLRAIRVMTGGTKLFSKVGDQVNVAPAFGSEFDAGSNLAALHTRLFSGLTGGTVAPADTTKSLKSNILNRVYQSYSDAKSSRKISSEDKLRLEQHMSQLSDLQARFTSSSGSPSMITCTSPTITTSKDFYQVIPAYLDMVAVAFKCGLSQFCVFESADKDTIPGFQLGAGESMHEAIHNAGQSNGGTVTNQALVDDAKRRRVSTLFHSFILNHVANRVMSPLNVEEGNSGKTYLDNTLTVFLTEQGISTSRDGNHHLHVDYQHLLLGNLGGALRSGRYYALPLKPSNDRSGWDPRIQQKYPNNMFWMSIFQMLGIPASEYSQYQSDKKGFGRYSGLADSTFQSQMYGPITEIIA